MTELTQKTNSIDRKTSDKTHPLRRKHRTSLSRRNRLGDSSKRELPVNRQKFLYLRSGETPPHGQEVLSTDNKKFEAHSTIVSEAKEKLRVLVQNRGGNACVDFDMRKEAGVKLANCYCTGDVVASGRAALIVPISLSPKEKESRKNSFSPDEKEGPVFALIGKVLPFVLILIFLFIMAKRVFQ